MRWLARLILLVGLCAEGEVLWAAPLEPCETGRLELRPSAQFLEDAGAQLTVDEVAGLSAEHFFAVTPYSLPVNFSNSAFWFVAELRNAGAERCERWLTVGEPRLSDIQVYLQRRNGWQKMQAGPDYPLDVWTVPSRQPLFPLALAGGEEARLLIRVSSRSLLLVDPLIWSDQRLLEDRQSAYLSDGMTFGIVLLLVPFAIALSWVLRSRLLFNHALSVLSYIALVSVINGYLINVPELLPWSRELTGILGISCYGLFLAYLRVLLNVRAMPRFWARLYSGYFAVLACCILVSLLFDHVLGRAALEKVRYFSGLLVLLTMVAGLRLGLRYNWLSWLVCGGLLLQGLARLLELWQMPWQSHQELLSISSTMPGVALLLGTLLMEINRTRRREKNALHDLEVQQQAENERLESTVERRTRQLRESLQARSSLMARISHDLRSPLTSIIAYARLLPKVAGEDYSRKIERNAQHQLELIDELLEFSRSEMHQLQLSLAPGYLYGFLREIEDEGRFLATCRNNVFDCRLASDLPLLVHADFRRLRQVLINLLSNAAKFTSNGRIIFCVSYKGEAGGGARLAVQISDSGIGIAADEREQLLQPFRRGRDVAHYDGSGLGLFIVAQLLEYMGGRLVVESTPGQGSCFSFELLLQRADEDELDIALTESYFGALEGVGRRILLVDDIEQNREWISDLLEGYGFDVSAVADGQQALECLADTPFDLLISDQMMPHMDGWQLLASVRVRWPQLPVLLYSAAPPLRDGNWPEALAFDACLLKPATSGELLAVIAGLLRIPQAAAGASGTPVNAQMG